MIKKFFLTLLILFVLLVIGLVVFLMTFDLNHYRSFVETLATNALGRPVKIQSLSTKLSLVPTINVVGVQILDDNQNLPVLYIPKLEAIVELTPLIHGQVTVPKINVPKANFIWMQNIEKSNSTASEDKPKAKVVSSVSSKNSKKLWIDTVSIDELNCRIGKDNPYKVTIDKFSLKELSKFSFNVIYDKKTISVAGNLGSVLELPYKVKLPVDLTLKQGKSSFKLNGRIDDLPRLQKMHFQVVLNIDNLSTFLKSWKIQNNKIPTSTMNVKFSINGDLNKMTLTKASLEIGKKDFVLNADGTLKQLTKDFTADLTTSATLANGSLSQLWGVKPFEATSVVQLSKTKAIFSDIVFNAAKSDAKGDLSIDWQKTPIYIKSNVTSTYLDLNDIINSSEAVKNAAGVQSQAKKTTGKSPFVLSTKKLPFDVLKKVNADVKLDVAHLKFSNHIPDYAAVKGSASIKDGNLTSPLDVQVLGGKVNNQITVNANKKKVSVKTLANGIQPDKIKTLAKDIKGTSTNIDLTLNGQGDSLHDIAGSLDGKLVVELTNGQIINKWFNTLPATLNVIKGRSNILSFSTTDQKTDLLCGVINMSIKKGIAYSNNQIALETDTLNFVVNGQVNLKEETINLKMIPSVSQTRGMANQLLETTQAISLVGPWTKITTKVNTGKVVENLAKIAEQKLTGNKTQNTSSSTAGLCQKALGRPLSKAVKTTQKTTPTPKTTTPTTPAKKQKPDLKQQLIQSLSQALAGSQ
ncbi:MAG: AsmA family protein [Alphaproteobacteria bacterium]|nr:AsmA family protein [Alphaproteobacteria bacterium]